MHYYQFNIADYRKDAGHLTPVEHYIYRWLIDEYHLSEQPFNNNMTKLLRRMSLDKNERNSLELVLEEFFIPACDDDYKPINLSEHPEYADIGSHPETCQYWIHNRIEQDISTYKQFIDKKSAAGKASAKARINKSSTGVQHQSTDVQLTTNHKPLTNKPITKDQKKGVKKFTPPPLSVVKAYCAERNNFVNPQKFIDFYESKGWMVGKNKMKSWEASIRTWEAKSEQESQKKEFKNTINTDLMTLGKQKNILPRKGESMESYNQRVRQSR